MSFDRIALAAAIAAHGTVARVVVAGVRGSAPREPGAAMIVHARGQSGTIGGGTLEFEAADRARALIADGRDRIDRLPLGPALGQCCGGQVTLVTEIWDSARLDAARGAVIARPLPGETGEMPLALRRRLADARGQGAAIVPGIVAGWLVEPVLSPSRPVWIWGAGHVGRAIAAVLAPLPQIEVTLIDTDLARFPDPLAPGVRPLVAARPADAVARAPDHAEHLILTFSHALDLELCHRILSRPFARAGLIGSATKAARFRSRLAALGHGPDRIARLDCPIGDPTLGKHPQAIALGVAADLLAHPPARALTPRERSA